MSSGFYPAALIKPRWLLGRNHESGAEIATKAEQRLRSGLQRFAVPLQCRHATSLYIHSLVELQIIRSERSNSAMQVCNKFLHTQPCTTAKVLIISHRKFTQKKVETFGSFVECTTTRKLQQKYMFCRLSPVAILLFLP